MASKKKSPSTFTALADDGTEIELEAPPAPSPVPVAAPPAVDEFHVEFQTAWQLTKTKSKSMDYDAGARTAHIVSGHDARRLTECLRARGCDVSLTKVHDDSDAGAHYELVINALGEG